MESEPLKILFIGNDERFARTVADLLRIGGPAEIATAPTMEAGLALLAANSFQAVLFEFPAANAAGLSQVTRSPPRRRACRFWCSERRTMKPFPPKSFATARRTIWSRNSSTPPACGAPSGARSSASTSRLALIEEKDNYYGIFDHLVEGIFRTTPDGHYLLANVALAHIYGYDSPVELMASIKDIGKRLYVEPARREEFVRLMQEHDTLKGFESLIYRKDGLVIWISENCRAVRDAQGKLLYYEGTVVDITQRRQMEQELRNSESLYHSLVETMPQNVFRKDLQGRFTFANQTILQALQLQAGGHPRQNGFRFFSEGTGGKIPEGRPAASWKPARPTKSSRNISRWDRRKPSFRSSKRRSYGADGSIIGLQGIFWDITAKNAPRNKSAARMPNWPAAARSCAPKTC